MAFASRKTLKTSVLVVLLALTGTALAWLAHPARNGSTGTHDDENIPSVRQATFDEEVLGARIPVLVDFYADWCGPCKQLAPVLANVARETLTGKIVKVNVDENPDLADRYSVSFLPTLIVFKDGQVITKQTGLVDKDRLKAMLSL